MNPRQLAAFYGWIYEPDPTLYDHKPAVKVKISTATRNMSVTGYATTEDEAGQKAIAKMMQLQKIKL